MSNIKVLEVPKWGLSMQEATINQWLISVGDRFEEGQPICELESSKIMNEMEAPFSSVLRHIIANPGDTVDVSGPLGICSEKELTDSEIFGFIESLGTHLGDVKGNDNIEQDAATTSKHASLIDKPQPDALFDNSLVQNRNVIPNEFLGFIPGYKLCTPRAERLAKFHNVNLESINGTGRNNRISVSDLINTINENGGNITVSAIEQMETSVLGAEITPAARLLARKMKIDISALKASEGNGKITKTDVLKAIKLKEGDVSPDTFVEQYKITGMRKIIAKRLSDSKLSAPHYRVGIDCNIDSLLEARKWINDTYLDVKVSVNDFVLKACSLALKEVTELNVQFDGETIKRFDSVDLSVAVAVDNGLITPIIKNADKMTLRQISQSARRLVTKAKAGTLTSEEFQGGTFTVSNLGMYGIKYFDAIINPPQVAILAVGAAIKVPAVVDDKVVIVNRVSFTLSSDHRIIDGAVAARFLGVLKSYIENPVALAV